MLELSFKNSAELNKIIDTKLPSKWPAFTKCEASLAGKKFDIYMRDIIECIKALYGDPEHSQYLVIVPERHYADQDKTIWLYHDMHTGQWWWSTQVCFWFYFWAKLSNMLLIIYRRPLKKIHQVLL